MRRAVVVSMVGLAIVVAACGSNPTPPPATPAPTQAVVETPAPTVAPTEAPSPTIDAAAFARKYAVISTRLTDASKAFSAALAKAKTEKAVKAAWAKYLAAYKQAIRSLKANDWPAAAKADIVKLLDAEDSLVTILAKAAANPSTVQNAQAKILKLEKEIQALAKKVKAELGAP